MPAPAVLAAISGQRSADVGTPAAGDNASSAASSLRQSVRSNSANAAGDEQSNLTPVATATPLPAGLQDQIVGGEKAKAGAWPWMVAIQAFTEPGYHTFCGASLVAPSWALTAAHCVINAAPDEIVATVGPHRLDSGQGQKRSVDRIVLHPRYGFDFAHDFAHDLALLHLQSRRMRNWSRCWALTTLIWPHRARWER